MNSTRQRRWDYLLTEMTKQPYHRRCKFYCRMALKLLRDHSESEVCQALADLYKLLRLDQEKEDQ